MSVSSPTSPAASRTFPLAAPGGKTGLMVWLLGLVLPLLITLVALALAFASAGPKKLIADSPGVTIAVTITLVLACCLPLCLLLQRGLRRSGATVAHGELDIRAGWYRQRIAIGSIDLAHARVLNLDEHHEYRPQFKTNGIALPGFHAGHFRLQYGRQKAFCMLSNRQRVLLLPEHSGRWLLLSVQRPQELLAALQAQSG